MVKEATRTLVVAGTDTGVGKTYVASALVRRARVEGWRAGGYKPVASGAVVTPHGPRNDDALKLMEAAGESNAGDGKIYAEVNPYCFLPPVAPHLAASAAGVEIRTERLDAAWEARARRFNLIIVEGAGGWQVPLNARQSFADWVASHAWPVILVVGLRLGCINHALLSAESISKRTRLVGWIANHVPPQMPWATGNVQTLRRLIRAPFVGEVATGDDAAVAAGLLEWATLESIVGADFTGQSGAV